MTDSEFETYLEMLGRLLRLSTKQRAEISFELRDHLGERLEELLSLGHSRADAVRIAVEELGDAGGLAEDFVSINQQKRRRWGMRFATFSIVGCFVGTLLIFSLWPDQDRLPLTSRSTAQESTAPADTTQAETVEARNTRTREKLEHSIVDCEYEQTPFSDILEDLRGVYGLESYLDESSDLQLDNPIILNLHQIRLSMALELSLRPHNSDYVIRDGIIFIASAEKIAEMDSEIRVYNCRDLVHDHATALDTAVEFLNYSDKGEAEGETDKAQEPVKSSPKEAQLSQLIRTIVSPQTWQEHSQSVVVYDGLMVVNNSAKVHDQIEELLTQLRRVGMQQASSTAGANPK